MKRSLTYLVLIALFAFLLISCNESVTYCSVVVISDGSLLDAAIVKENGGYTLPDSPEREGYTFTGWKINNNDEICKAGEEITVTGNTRVTAVWKRLCTVTFDMDGGLEQKSLILPEGESVPKPTLAVKAGYDIAGWETEDGEEYDFATPLKDDITIKAVWKYHEYSIGDTGPAGGYIFYDCDADNESGNADGLKSEECGWRYLEVAPAEVYPSESWGDEIAVKTEAGIGKGKTNTERMLRIVEYNAYYSFTAAENAAGYTLNGYDDWFLPREKELLALYENETLKNKFRQKYWSSTTDDSTKGDYTKVMVCLSSSGSYSYNRNPADSTIIINSIYILPVRSF